MSKIKNKLKDVIVVIYGIIVLPVVICLFVVRLPFAAVAKVLEWIIDIAGGGHFR